MLNFQINIGLHLIPRLENLGIMPLLGWFDTGQVASGHVHHHVCQLKKSAMVRMGEIDGIHQATQRSSEIDGRSASSLVLGKIDHRRCNFIFFVIPKRYAQIVNFIQIIAGSFQLTLNQWQFRELFRCGRTSSGSNALKKKYADLNDSAHCTTLIIKAAKCIDSPKKISRHSVLLFDQLRRQRSMPSDTP